MPGCGLNQPTPAKHIYRRRGLWQNSSHDARESPRGFTFVLQSQNFCTDYRSVSKPRTSQDLRFPASLKWTQSSAQFGATRSGRRRGFEGVNEKIDDYKSRWSAICRMLASRPSLWQVFSGELGLPATFAPKFIMRQSALIMLVLHSPTFYKVLKSRARARTRQYDSTRKESAAFCGVLDSPETIMDGKPGKGNLQGPAFSPVGGWAAQTAEFANGKDKNSFLDFARSRKQIRDPGIGENSHLPSQGQTCDGL